MPTYLVRTIDEHDLVGIFVAPNPFELALLIDEGLDPGVCEYQRLVSGGIMWTGPAVAIPTDDNLSEDELDDPTLPDPIPWDGASFTEGWDAAVHGTSGRRWRRLLFDLDDIYYDGPENPPDDPAGIAASTARVLQFRKRGN